MDDSYGAGQPGAGVQNPGGRKRGPLRRLAGSRTGRWIWGGAAILGVFLLFYYPTGMLLTHEIDDDLDFALTGTIDSKSSRAVAMSAALIDREVNGHGWRANDPFFMPSSMLDNTPNYQQGIVAALARFSFELTDQDARTGTSGQADPELQKASGLLQYSGTKWFFNSSASETQYRKARRALLNYNARLRDGGAVFERRAGNLGVTLRRMAADLGSSSTALAERMEQGHTLFDRRADDVFYGVKGQAYANYLLLRELRVDFDTVIVKRELDSAWSEMLGSMGRAAALQPWFVVNGAPDSQFFANHLGAQAFFLLRARAQLREITDTLLN